MSSLRHAESPAAGHAADHAGGPAERGGEAGRPRVRHAATPPMVVAPDVPGDADPSADRAAIGAAKEVAHAAGRAATTSGVRSSDAGRPRITDALRYVQQGVRSIQEVRAFLQHRGVSHRDTEQLLLAYQAKGLLNDSTCARLWTEQWARQGYAWSAIETKLREKGLTPEAASATPARSAGKAADDEARAWEITRKVLGRRMSRTPRRKGHAALRSQGAHAKQRTTVAASLARTLAARGFNTDVIERIVNETRGSAYPPTD